MPATTESRLHLSEIAPRIIQSEIRSMTVECDAVGGVNMAQGVCDTPLPEVVVEAIRRMCGVVKRGGALVVSQ